VAAPNGFINITLSTPMLVNSIQRIVKDGVTSPTVAVKRVLVDFSSPNIAKEMHVVSSDDDHDDDEAYSDDDDDNDRVDYDHNDDDYISSCDTIH